MTPLLRFLLFLRLSAKEQKKGHSGARLRNNNKKSLSLSTNPDTLLFRCPETNRAAGIAPVRPSLIAAQFIASQVKAMHCIDALVLGLGGQR